MCRPPDGSAHAAHLPRARGVRRGRQAAGGDSLISPCSRRQARSSITSAMPSDGREMPKRKPAEPDGSSPSPRRRESLHVHVPPLAHLHSSPNAAGSAEPASSEPEWADRRASLALGFGVGRGVVGRLDVAAPHAKLRYCHLLAICLCARLRRRRTENVRLTIWRTSRIVRWYCRCSRR